jgi:hypothetical protein
MTAQPHRTITPVGVVGALFIIAVIVAASRGYTTSAVLLALIGFLITCQALRNRIRSRMIYNRHRRRRDARRSN